MDIDGLGEKQVATFQRLGLVRTAADFYRLDPEQLLELDGYGQVSVDNAAALDRGLQGAAVRRRAVRHRHRGRRLCHRPQPRRSASGRSMRCWRPRPRRSPRRQGIGPIVATLIAEQLADEQMRALIADLRGLGLTFEQEGPPPGEGPAGRQDVRAHRHAARPHARGGAASASSARVGASPRRCPRRPTTSSPALRRAPSSRRPSASAWPCSTSPRCGRYSSSRAATRTSEPGSTR